MAATTEQAISDEQATQIKFRFCKNCANLLYPSEDRGASRLLFQCRHCNLAEPSETHCVFRNDLSNAVGETAGITQDVGLDPTVRDEIFPSSGVLCTGCGAPLSCETCGKSAEGEFDSLQFEVEGECDAWEDEDSETDDSDFDTDEDLDDDEDGPDDDAGHEEMADDDEYVVIEDESDDMDIDEIVLHQAIDELSLDGASDDA